LKTASKATTRTKAKLNLNSRVIKTIIQAIDEKKGEHIISLNLKKIPEAIADYFIVCEAGNPNLIKAIADNVEKRVWEETGEKPFKIEGRQGDKWILIDYVDVVVHCLMPEARAFYQLEDLWQDAERQEHQLNP